MFFQEAFGSIIMMIIVIVHLFTVDKKGCT